MKQRRTESVIFLSAFLEEIHGPIKIRQSPTHLVHFIDKTGVLCNTINAFFYILLCLHFRRTLLSSPFLFLSRHIFLIIMI